NLVTQSLARKAPALAQRLIEEQQRLIPLRERRKAIACRDRTAALVTIADAVISRYQAEKDRRGLLDYDDLIEKTLALLDKVDAAWVHYKLDRGIDHVLIDEAQDTSPQQWRIIRALTTEVFAGAGAGAVRRVDREQRAGAAGAEDRAPYRALESARAPRRRRARAGAPARSAVRSDYPRAQGRRNPGRRRRPAGADRAHRGDGPDGAGR